MLQDLGAVVLDADRAGHEVLELPEVRELIRQRWGDDSFNPDNSVNRRRLGQHVFGSSPECRRQREYLESITHPRIGEMLASQVAQSIEQKSPAVVLDAPLMLEAGWDRMCDSIVFVDVPLQQRLSRALARGWTKEEFDARESAQESLDRKREQADVVIDNSGSPQAARQQVQRFWDSLVG